VHVRDVESFAAYVASVGDLYEEDVAAWMSWDDVVRECAERVASIIAECGSFRVSTVVGAFVCRG
jgi:hypothetical protein